MTVNRIVRIIAGFFIMLSLGLAHFMGQVDLTRMSWLWFTLFVGANLFQSGFTTFCPLGNLMVGQSIELKNGEYHWRCIVESKSNEAVILKPFLDLNRRPL